WVMLVAVTRQQPGSQVERQRLVVCELDRVKRAPMIEGVAAALLDQTGAAAFDQKQIAADRIRVNPKLARQVAGRISFRPPRQFALDVVKPLVTRAGPGHMRLHSP